MYETWHINGSRHVLFVGIMNSHDIKKRLGGLEASADAETLCLHLAVNNKFLRLLFNVENLKSSQKGGRKEIKKEKNNRKKKTNPLILFPYRAALNLTHSYWEWRRGWKLCQVVRSVANSNLHFPPPSSAQSPLRASSFLQSHPDVSCLHLFGNSPPFDHILLPAEAQRAVSRLLSIQ